VKSAVKEDIAYSPAATARLSGRRQPATRLRRPYGG